MAHKNKHVHEFKEIFSVFDVDDHNKPSENLGYSDFFSPKTRKLPSCYDCRTKVAIIAIRTLNDWKCWFALLNGQLSNEPSLGVEHQA